MRSSNSKNPLYVDKYAKWFKMKLTQFGVEITAQWFKLEC